MHVKEKEIEVVEELLEDDKNDEISQNREDVDKEHLDPDFDDDEDVSDVGEEVNVKPIGPISMPVKTATPSIKHFENDVNFASIQSDRNMMESSRIDLERVKEEKEMEIYK